MLDTIKRREILAILGVGGSRRVAAGYVGCSVSTIGNTIRRDSEFAEQVRQKERQSEIAYLENIRNAAKNERYWRAAAWALERINPERYGKRKGDFLTLEQVSELMARFSEIIVEEVPTKYRKSILKRFNAILHMVRDLNEKKGADHEA